MSRRMSHYLTPAQNVSIPAPMSVPRAYFLQDDADFSDGECETQYAWPEGPSQNPGPSTQMHENMVQGPPPDVTELYRRKPEDHYVVSQEVVMADEPRYYYRPAALARLPQRRLPLSVTPSAHGGTGGVQVPHPGAYFTPPHEEPRVQYEGVMYRSSPHLHRMVEGSTARVLRRQQQLNPDVNPQVSNIVRRPGTSTKPAVSVPTPRFYRRNVYKRPSTLCLQLPSSPDPARPIKSRLPSTMPGLSIPPLSLRSAHCPHYQSQQQMSGLSAGRGHFTGLERARTNILIGGENEIEDRYRGRGVRRQLTARSAPPRCEERGKEEDEMERMQRAIMEQRIMHHEFGDESASNAGEADPKCSELELLLNQYEQIFSSGPEAAPVPPRPTGSRRSSTRRAKRKASSGRIVGLMKPRLPPSLKTQKRTSSKSSIKHPRSSSAEEDRLEIEQMTAEVLDNLLQDLSVGGLAGDSQPAARGSRPSSEVRRSESKQGKPMSRGESRTGSRTESRSGSRAMSARGKLEKSAAKDLGEKVSSKNITSKKSDFTFTQEIKPPAFDEIPTKTTFMQDKEKFSKFTNSSHTSFEQDKSTLDRNSRDQTPTFALDEDKDKLQTFKKDVVEAPGGKDTKKTSWMSSKRSSKHEDHAALELHRSKSYIVNLIDRALSRELGTIPEERSSKQYLNLDARTAMDLISSKNMDTDMCLEITQAIADSLSSVQQKETPTNTINPPPCCSTKTPDSARGEPSKPEGELMFSTGNEEPLYIKQLKKLRWGHLKHIQREMRRLEDLERFLDSCSSDK